MPLKVTFSQCTAVHLLHNQPNIQQAVYTGNN